MDTPTPLTLHGFNQWSYCPHRFFLMYRCGEMARNAHVYRGLRAHQRVDRPTRRPERATAIFSMAVHHAALGLSGVIDLVEYDTHGQPIPVETKAGRAPGGRPWPNDVLQVAAQAVCLEAVTGLAVERGFIYYAGSRRRVEVPITPALRREVEAACTDMRDILDGRLIPTPTYAGRCEGCSLFEACLPRAQAWLDARSTP